MIAWALMHWKLLAFAAVLSALGVQTYRLQGAHGELAVIAERDAANARLLKQRARQDFLNKERTDAEYLAALERARALSRVRTKPAPAIVAAKPAPVARSGDEAAICFDRRAYDDALADYSRAHAHALSAVLTELSRLDDVDASEVARVGEEIAAAFRSCAVFARHAE